ncbi:MAG: 30S ribosomal protein S12 methylthiotransferase RimO [Clostridiales bacterium]|nr:30S ribosomal protein S12 methylthiotransferase RimO [Clostridiales bacterium]
MNIYIDTLGCPKNVVDSENMAGLLEKSGHLITDDLMEAQAIIVNTCGFIDDAKEESIDRIFELAKYKENGAILIVTGCLSERYKHELFKEMPEADIFLGVNDYHKLPDIINEYSRGSRETHFGSCDKLYTEIESKKSMGKSYSSYLKIAEGCDNICAYCIIPQIRGSYRSRKEENIIKEAKSLASNGCKELILVAQDVTAYGIDLYGEYRLASLLEKLCEIEGLHWIRLMYCYEDRITEKLIEVIKSNEKICKYIDIPIQHISDKILLSMNRRSTKESIKKTIKKLRENIPEIHIRTTLITGFPGETDDDFEELMNFIEETRFERLGVFAYSKEEGTAAASMKNQVSEQVKIERKDAIMSLQCNISLENNMKHIGKTIEVLVEEIEADSYIGRTEYDSPEIDNSVIFTSDEQLKPGDFVFVKISDAFDYDLVGYHVKRG